MKSISATVPVVGLELGLEDQRARRGTAASDRRAPRPPGRSASGRARASPSSAAKHAPESNRGKHSQSIEPSRPTSAAVWQSPIRA